MKKFGTIFIMFAGLLTLFFIKQVSADDTEKEIAPMTDLQAHHPRVLLTTTIGDITIELYPEKAPLTVKNFMQYVNEGFYKHTIFHRVIPGFMVQGGGFTKEMKQKPTHAAIKNEAHNGLKNQRGTIAMARTSDVDSATGQFFINVVDNDFLNFKDKTARGYGYAVFGKVVEGMDVVDKMAAAKTGVQNGHGDVPVTAIEIIDAKLKN